MHQGMILQGRKQTYTIHAPLGEPGLYGAAYLAFDPDKTLVAIKALRVDRGLEDTARVIQEAQTLRRVAEVESAHGVHCAVRVLDESPEQTNRPFIVLEVATGQNVQRDLLDRVVDWEHAPLADELVLTIAHTFAQALALVHQAGICYDDMKLDNLFWDANRPDGQPLRIIDWNVVSDVKIKGVVGDWSRFGARLYQLFTGAYIGITRDGDVEGDLNRAPRWASLAYGLKAIINRALHPQIEQRYLADQDLLADLAREIKLRSLAFDELLRQARIGIGSKQWQSALSALDLAKRWLQQQPMPDQRAFESIAQLEAEAEAGVGFARNEELASGKRLLARDEFILAVERFQRVFNSVQGQDSRARWWLWLAELAQTHGRAWYSNVRNELEAGVQSLELGEYAQAAKTFGLLSRRSDEQLINALLIEAISRSQVARFNAEAASLDLPTQIKTLTEIIAEIGPLTELIERFGDLKAWLGALQLRLHKLERQHAQTERINRQLAAAEEQTRRADGEFKQQQWQAAQTTYHAARLAYLNLLNEYPDLAQSASILSQITHIDQAMLVTRIELGLVQQTPIEELEALLAQLIQIQASHHSQFEVTALQTRIQTERMMIDQTTERLRQQVFTQTQQVLNRWQQQLQTAIVNFDQPSIIRLRQAIAALEIPNDPILLEQVVTIEHLTEQVAHQMQAASEHYEQAIDAENRQAFAEAFRAFQHAADRAPLLTWLSQRGQANAEQAWASARHALAKAQPLIEQAAALADLGAAQQAQMLLIAHVELLPPGAEALNQQITASYQQSLNLIQELSLVTDSLSTLQQTAKHADASFEQLDHAYQAAIDAVRHAPSITWFSRQAMAYLQMITLIIQREYNYDQQQFGQQTLNQTPDLVVLDAFCSRIKCLLQSYSLNHYDLLGPAGDQLATFVRSYHELLQQVQASYAREQQRQQTFNQAIQQSEAQKIASQFEQALEYLSQAKQFAQSPTEQVLVEQKVQSIESAQLLVRQQPMLIQAESALLDQDYERASRLLRYLSEQTALHPHLHQRYQSLQGYLTKVQQGLEQHTHLAQAAVKLLQDQQQAWQRAEKQILDATQTEFWSNLALADNNTIQLLIGQLQLAKDCLQFLVEQGRNQLEQTLLEHSINGLRQYLNLLADLHSQQGLQGLAEAEPQLTKMVQWVELTNFQPAIQTFLKSILEPLHHLGQFWQQAGPSLEQIQVTNSLTNSERAKVARQLEAIAGLPVLNHIDAKLRDRTQCLLPFISPLSQLAHELELQWQQDLAIRRFEREPELWVAAAAVRHAEYLFYQLGGQLPARNTQASDFWGLIDILGKAAEQFSQAVRYKINWLNADVECSSQIGSNKERAACAKKLNELFSAVPISELDPKIIQTTDLLKPQFDQLASLQKEFEQQWEQAVNRHNFTNDPQLWQSAIDVQKAREQINGLLEIPPQPNDSGSLDQAIEHLSHGQSALALWILTKLPQAELTQFNLRREHYAQRLLNQSKHQKQAKKYTEARMYAQQAQRIGMLKQVQAATKQLNQLPTDAPAKVGIPLRRYWVWGLVIVVVMGSIVGGVAFSAGLPLSFLSSTTTPTLTPAPTTTPTLTPAPTTTPTLTPAPSPTPVMIQLVPLAQPITLFSGDAPYSFVVTSRLPLDQLKSDQAPRIELQANDVNIPVTLVEINGPQLKLQIEPFADLLQLTPSNNSLALPAAAPISFNLTIDQQLQPGLEILIGQTRSMLGVTQENGALPTTSPLDGTRVFYTKFYSEPVVDENKRIPDPNKPNDPFGISNGDLVDILEVNGDWYRIRLRTNFDPKITLDPAKPFEGWIERKFVDNVKPESN